MKKNFTILVIIVVLIAIVALTVTFYRTVVQRNYTVINEEEQLEQTEE